MNVSTANVFSSNGTSASSAVLEDLADSAQIEQSELLVNQAQCRLDRSCFEFLVNCSILRELSASACDDMLEIIGSAAMLERLVQHAPFLTALDRNGQRFAMHPLLRLGLRRQLAENRSALTAATLHERAGNHYRRLGESEAAIYHFLQADDHERAADALAELWGSYPLRVTPHLLTSFAGRGLEGYAPYVLTDAAVRHQSGDAAAVSNALELLQESTWSGPLPQGYTSIETATAAFRGMLPSIDEIQTRSDIETVVQGELSRAGPRRLLMQFDVAFRAYMLGEFEQAHEHIAAVLVGHRSVGRHTYSDQLATILAVNLQSVMEHDGGQTAQARIHQTYALELTDRYGIDSMPREAEQIQHLCHAVVVDLEPLDRSKKLRRLSKSAAQLTVRLHAATELIRHLDAAGEAEEARLLLEDALGIVEAKPPAPMLEQRLQLLETAMHVDTRSPDQMTPGERRLLLLLIDEATQAQMGDALGLSVNTIKSQVRRIYEKLGVSSRNEAVAAASKQGLLASVLPWTAADKIASN